MTSLMLLLLHLVNLRARAPLLPPKKRKLTMPNQLGAGVGAALVGACARRVSCRRTVVTRHQTTIKRRWRRGLSSSHENGERERAAAVFAAFCSLLQRRARRSSSKVIKLSYAHRRAFLRV